LSLSALEGLVVFQICTSPIQSVNPKLIPIDEQPDDDVMHLNGLGKTDRFTGEPFNPGPQGKMFPLDLR
jgi:hypothetical protein